MKLFRLKLIILLSLLFITMVAFSFVVGRSAYLFTQIVLFAIISVLLWQCFYLLSTTHRQISKFLHAIKHHDHTVVFPEKSGFKELHSGLNHAIEQLANLKEEHSQQIGWKEEVIQRMPIGILIIQRQEQVEYINAIASNYLKISSLQHISQLQVHNSALASMIQDIPYEQHRLYTTQEGEELNFYKVKFQDAQLYEIVFIQAFKELQGEVEMDAWLKLIGVLTHEVMNSITSISSLADTLHEHLQTEQASIDMQEAAASIAKRSQRLVSFTESYREVSHISAPQKSWFFLSEAVQECQRFLQLELGEMHITIKNEGEQRVFADRKQMEQVFINLLLNAKSAAMNKDSSIVSIDIKTIQQTIVLSITDNGRGISSQQQNQIFIPFFTTREDGKGIGLSLSRQLMRNNGGSISLKKSIPGETTFELRWSLVQ